MHGHRFQAAVALAMAATVLPLTAGADDASDRNRRKAESDFVAAARWGRADAVERALANGIDVDALDDEGITALRWAAVEGQAPIVRLLVDAGADVDAADGQGVTGLMMAARWGYQEIVAAVLDAGAEVDLMSSIGPGRTALMYAAIAGRDEIVAVLLSAAADPTITDGHGRTAAALAELWGKTATAELLRAAEQAVD